MAANRSPVHPDAEGLPWAGNGHGRTNAATQPIGKGLGWGAADSYRGRIQPARDDCTEGVAGRFGEL